MILTASRHRGLQFYFYTQFSLGAVLEQTGSGLKAVTLVSHCPRRPGGLITTILFRTGEITPLNFLWQHPGRLRGPSCCRFCESSDIYFPDAADLTASCCSSSRRCEKTHLSPNTRTPAQCDAEHNRLYSTTRQKYRHFYNSRFFKKKLVSSAQKQNVTFRTQRSDRKGQHDEEHEVISTKR